jgi:hypothetical protein
MLAEIEAIVMRTFGGILIVLVGLAWEFSAKLSIFVDQITSQKLQAWVAEHSTLIIQIAPLTLIGGGVLWILYLHAWPALQRRLRPSDLTIIYNPPEQTSAWRRTREYYH